MTTTSTRPAADPEFEALLNYLKEVRNFDFTAYKRSSLMRRVQKRMQTLHLTSYTDYLDYLQVHQDEFVALFNTILINVTTFLRDEPAWDFLRQEIIPRIIASKKPEAPIRVWSAGCASGEEAYTIAMLLAEILGQSEFRQRVKIYATDVDEEALSTARQALYDEKRAAAVPDDLREKYFSRSGNRFMFSKDLRRTIIFGRHDLLQDAPISRVDLLICRNTLMYFNSEAQARILARFHYAISDGGYLFLGKAETLLTHGRGFAPVSMKFRIFARSAMRVNMRDRLLFLGEDEPEMASLAAAPPPALQEIAFESDLVPQIVVDAGGTLLLANRSSRDLLGIRVGDVGRPFQDVEASYRPVELRSVLARVFADKREQTLREVQFGTHNGMPRWMQVGAAPLFGTDGRLVAAKVAFNDISRARELSDELTVSKRELETAYEELQSSNEELETTNEELQSTVEELETTNEELETVNDELRERGNQLNTTNSFMEAILTNLRVGVMVIDREQRVRAWNRRAEDLWGVRADEAVGAYFLNLDIGLKLDSVGQQIRDCLVGKRDEYQTEMPATNRRGRPIRCRLTCNPMMQDSQVQGAVLLMEEVNNINGGS